MVATPFQRPGWMDDGSPRISHQAAQIRDEVSTIHCKSLAKQAHSLVLKFPHDLSYFYVQPASAVFIFPASSPACFTGAGLDTQGVRQIIRPVLQKARERVRNHSLQINTSVLWLPGKLRAWDLGEGGELGVGGKVQGKELRGAFSECV